MNGLCTQETVVTDGYQLCEGCGKVMVKGDRASAREIVIGTYDVHRDVKCVQTAPEYLSEKEPIERGLFPVSSAEIYGEKD